MIYEWIGRQMLHFAWLRFGRQIKIVSAATALLAASGVYLLSRKSPPEG